MTNPIDMYVVNEPIDSGKLITEYPQVGGAGLAKVKIDMAVFRILHRKRRAGETVRMALERAIMTL